MESVRTQGNGIVVFVPEADLAQAEAIGLPEAVAIRGIRTADNQLVVRVTDHWHPLVSLPGLALGVLALSKQGHDAATAVIAAWKSQFGVDDLALLSAAPGSAGTIDTASAQRLVLAALAGRHVEVVRRNTALSRAMAQLRQVHDATQAAFERLEARTFEMKDSRSLDQTLSAHAGTWLALSPGQQLVQRLPGMSVGLCDVALRFAEAPTDLSGSLEVLLKLDESDEVVARWQVDATYLKPGWLRLSMNRSLGMDAQTPSLEVIWSGGSPLKLELSALHPDARWCASVGAQSQTRILALKTWKGLPAAVLSVAGGAVIEAKSTAREVVFGQASLEGAENISGGSTQVAFSEGDGGLLVQPSADATAVARLREAVPTRIRRVSVSLETREKGAPVVSYALALSRTAKGPLTPESLNQPELARMSEWLSVPAQQWATLNFFLDEPTSEMMDIYLLTRLAPGTQKAGPVKACIYRVTANG